MISSAEYRALALVGMQDFEVLKGHPIYSDGLPLPLLHELRFRWMIDALTEGLQYSGRFVPGAAGGEEEAVVLSVGCFPGSFDRVLKAWYQSRIHLFGVGLAVSEEFKTAFLGKVYDQILAVELDPRHPSNLMDKYPSVISLGDGVADAVVAGELFEHLYSPLHFIGEISRVLKPGGHLILTTPNICYIGNLIKLAFVVPRFRNNLCQIYRKTEEGMADAHCD